MKIVPVSLNLRVEADMRILGDRTECEMVGGDFAYPYL